VCGVWCFDLRAETPKVLVFGFQFSGFSLRFSGFGFRTPPSRRAPTGSPRTGLGLGRGVWFSVQRTVFGLQG